MSRVRMVAVTLVAAILAILSICQTRAQLGTARVPDRIRQEIAAQYQSIASDVSWRTYRQVGDTGFAIAEWRETPACPWTNVEVFRIKSAGEPRLSRWSMRWFGGKFEAGCGFTLDQIADPTGQLPTEQYAVGIALDKRIARVIASTKGGTNVGTGVFHGYWWISAEVDLANCVEDRWVEIRALDAEGNILAKCQPQYLDTVGDPPPR